MAAYSTFVGPGLGTLQQSSNGASAGVPPVHSRRGTLRNAMPAIYRENHFAMPFIGALEGVLDPIAATLDALPEHFHPDYAPRPVLDLLGAWLGVEIDEVMDIDARREAVRMAAEAGRRRGTLRGLTLALRLNFPDLPIRGEDEGGGRWGADRSPVTAGTSRFIVYVDTPIPEDRQASIARCVEREKPVQTTYRLRVKTPKAGGGSAMRVCQSCGRENPDDRDFWRGGET